MENINDKWIAKKLKIYSVLYIYIAQQKMNQK